MDGSLTAYNSLHLGPPISACGHSSIQPLGEHSPHQCGPGRHLRSPPSFRCFVREARPTGPLRPSPSLRLCCWGCGLPLQAPGSLPKPRISWQAEPPRPQVCKFCHGPPLSSGSFSGPKLGVHLTAAGPATLRHLSSSTIARTATPFTDPACLRGGLVPRASQASAAASPPLSHQARLQVMKAPATPP
ncbi:hypothetical protein NDU88_005270 [Pleurodeles waltl]|uniref:Uncharacterized protein n=1 Tax=Pleurodeles waltl TaxID=8319 RepID=A0AAV7UHM1_PLEWA|nr:hypothetical protein NDU88_005270 [Pleurodeles waltl]